jgi:5'-nucleotidase
VTRILLTNDDGVDSPALLPFAHALSALGEVVVCVPDRERSWVGKAITRVDPVRLDRVERGGLEVHTCSGFPADAAQLGIHVIGPRPDLVVSGINLGMNHGAAFLMSSGTVGAAVEGWVSGLPAVAFSTGDPDMDFGRWTRHVWDPGTRPAWERLAATCVAILGDLVDSGLPAHTDVTSVNLPFDATEATPRRLTSIARTGYGELFQPAEEPGTYRHRFSSVTEIEPVDTTDVEAANDRVVSVTPVRLPAAATVPPEVRRRVEREDA